MVYHCRTGDVNQRGSRWVIALSLTLTFRSEQWSQAFFSLEAGGLCVDWCFAFWTAAWTAATAALGMLYCCGKGGGDPY